MKLVPCSYSGCSDRRVHHERPHIMRNHVHFEVPSDYEGPAYCSIECECYAKAQAKEKSAQSPTT